MKHLTAFLKSNLANLFKLYMCVHVCSGAQSFPTFATLWTVAYQAPLSMEFPIRWLSMQEMWVQSLGQKDPLEKEMASHASIFAWEIPGTVTVLESYSPQDFKE